LLVVRVVFLDGNKYRRISFGDCRGEIWKANTEISAIWGTTNQVFRQQKYYKRKQVPNSDDINNITRQLTTLYQLAQYWQMNSTQRDMMEFVITAL